MINSWSISGNSCKKIISAIRAISFNPLLKKIHVICAICGRYIRLIRFNPLLKKISVHLCNLWSYKLFSCHLMVSEYAGAVPRNSSA